MQVSLLYNFWVLTPSVEISGRMPSAFKELCCPINSNSAKYHEAVTYTTDSEPESTDTGTQDCKDAEEKEAKNVYEYLTKGCYPQGASKADKSVLRRMSKNSQVVDEIFH